jgi:hypothetical protein
MVSAAIAATVMVGQLQGQDKGRRLALAGPLPYMVEASRRGKAR